MTTKNIFDMIRNKRQDISSKTQQRERPVNPPDGSSKWRILPSWRSDDTQFWHEFGQHFIKGADGTTKAVYVCVNKTYDQDCPICQQLASASRVVHDEGLSKIIAGARASQRILVNALRLDSDKPNDPVVLSIPFSLFEQILAAIDDSEVDITDLDEGRNVTITRAGGGLSTTYTLTVDLKASKPINHAVMEKITNLDQYVNQASAAGQQRALAAVSSIAGALPKPAEFVSDAEFEDAPPFDVPVASKPAAKKAAAAPSKSEEDDLENLLSELD